jgi:hypothetical protein
VNGQYGIVDIEGTREKRLDLNVGKKGLEIGEKFSEVSAHVLALGFEFHERIEIIDEPGEFVDGLDPGFQGTLFFEERCGLLGVVPEVGGGGCTVDFAQAAQEAFLVKDNS